MKALALCCPRTYGLQEAASLAAKFFTEAELTRLTELAASPEFQRLVRVENSNRVGQGLGQLFEDALSALEEALSAI